MAQKIIITGNCNRKIWNAKAGSKLRCKTLTEAHTIYCMAVKMGVKLMRRGAVLFFKTEINREKYEWTSGEPKKEYVKPSLGSVE
ncbi:MAG TPA: hypothetical protein VFM18_01825 [Methanosarcina sp.]|nr:hypothetical protein [Methanosarcina sp.]